MTPTRLGLRLMTLLHQQHKSVYALTKQAGVPLHTVQRVWTQEDHENGLFHYPSRGCYRSSYPCAALVTVQTGLGSYASAPAAALGPADYGDILQHRAEGD